MTQRKINRKSTNRQEKRKTEDNSYDWQSDEKEMDCQENIQRKRNLSVIWQAVRVKAWWVSDMAAQGGRSGTTAARNHPQSILGESEAGRSAGKTMKKIM